MKRILFVCYGNICRSPMAEFLMKDLLKKAGLSEEVEVKSAGTHAEVGTGMHRGTRKELEKHGIAFGEKISVQLRRADYDKYDYIIGLDKSNVDDIEYQMGGDPLNKIKLLMDYAGEHRDVDDPWYTNDYATTYADVLRGCEGLLNAELRMRNAECGMREEQGGA